MRLKRGMLVFEVMALCAVFELRRIAVTRLHPGRQSAQSGRQGCGPVRGLKGSKRIMPDWLVAPLAGLGIVAFGLVLLRSHVRSWKQQQADPSLDENERLFYERRYRRRMQTTAMLIGIGAMISVGDQIVPLNPTWSTVFWAVVLLATFWMVFQALGDMAHTKVHTRANLARLRRRQRELREELSRLRDQHEI